MSVKKKIIITVRLIIEKDEHLLMLKQTIKNGGNYTLVGGKIDKQELAIQALIRETEEEAGIVLREKKVKLIHVAQINQGGNMHIILVFKAKKWKGIISSREEKKFLEALWVPTKNLPKNIPPKIKHILHQYLSGSFYSELNYVDIGV